MRKFVFNDESRTDDEIRITTTSKHTVETDLLPLRETTTTSRLVFKPTLLRGVSNPTNNVEGKIIYERKGKNDRFFPSEFGERDMSKRDVKHGDSLELSFNSSETRKLYDALKKSYELAGSLEKDTYGTSYYVRVDDVSKSFLDMLRNEASAARIMSDDATFSLVRELLKLLAEGKTHREIEELFDGLEQPDVQRLANGLSIQQLLDARNVIRSHLDNPHEEFWQNEVFNKYPWILSQIFATPCLLFDEKAYVGGKSIDNHGGDVADFIVQNQVTKNVSIIEIKTPKTKILGCEYREHAYSVSSEMSGAVNQVLDYKQKLLLHFASLRMSTELYFEAISPKCVVIIGNSEEFKNMPNEKKRKDATSSFENYRNTLNGITVITYDELLIRIENLIKILKPE